MTPSPDALSRPIRLPVGQIGADLRGIETWVFDLDNTLYPAACNLFAEVEERITAFVSRTLDLSSADARLLQKHYYTTYGTTLSGLMQMHGVPADTFLDYVHDISLDPLDGLPSLHDGLARLPGRKLIYTNGTQRHAERVLERLGLSDHFSGLHDIVASAHRPKPDAAAFADFLERFGVDPHNGVMFEDLSRNLRPAFDQGMRTVLVCSPETVEWTRHEPSHVRPGHHEPDDRHLDFITDRLDAFLMHARVGASEAGREG